MAAQVADLALEGRKFLCCVLLESPVAVVDNNSPRTGNVSGLAIDYLRQLQEETGFRCLRIGVYAPTAPKYEGFSGFVRYLDSCVKSDGDSSECNCQLGVAGFARTPERNAKVDFVAPFKYGSIGMAESVRTMRGATLSPWFAFQPFALEVWGFIFLLVLAFIAAGTVSEHFLKNGRQKCCLDEAVVDLEGGSLSQATATESTWRERTSRLFEMKLMRSAYSAVADFFFMTMFSFLGAHSSASDPRSLMTDQEYVQPPRRHYRRWQCFSLLAMMVGLLFVIIYEAAIVVKLFERKPSSRFNSLADLKNCNVDASKVCLSAGGAVQDFWAETIEKARKSCRKRSFKDDQPTLIKPANGLDSYTIGLERTADPADDGCEFFMGSTSLVTRAANTKFCGKLAVVGEPFYPLSSGFVAPKNSNFTKILDETTLRLQQENKLANVVEKGQVCNSSSNSGTIGKEARPVFYILFLVLLGFVVLNYFFR